MRGRWHEAVELTVVDAVPDIMRFVVGLVALPTGRSFVPTMSAITERQHLQHVLNDAIRLIRS